MALLVFIIPLVSVTADAWPATRFLILAVLFVLPIEAQELPHIVPVARSRAAR